MAKNKGSAVQSILLDHEVMKTFPKVELHRHLEGTFHIPTLHAIAMRNGLPYSKDMKAFSRQVQFPKESEPDFLEFLSKFKNDWYRNYKDVEELTYESVKAMKDDGIFYIELRFSPEHFAYHNDFDRKEITNLVIQSANRAAGDAGFQIRYLLTFNRMKQTAEEMIELYRELKELNHKEVVGIDLAGDETNYPPEDFAPFFDIVARDRQYKATVHAGEVSPSQQIWNAIKLLHASRIGHGVSAIEDKELQEYLKEHGIALEQCITSNYQTGSWADESTHPFGELYRLGVPVTINSDDPHIQDTDLTEDYVKAAKYFDLTIDDIEKINLIAIQASFVSEKEKNALLQAYKAAVLAFRRANRI